MFLGLFVASFVPLTQISARWGWEAREGAAMISLFPFCRLHSAIKRVLRDHENPQDDVASHWKRSPLSQMS